MDKGDVVWQKLRYLLRDYNFVAGAEPPVACEAEAFLSHLEMLILLKKINLKRRLSSRIYLAMLHSENKEVFRLVRPSGRKLSVLILLGKLLGFRI